MWIFYCITVVGCWPLVFGKSLNGLLWSYGQRPKTNDALPNLQHPVQCRFRPILHVVLHFYLVDHIAFREIFQHPAQMLRRDTEHGGAQAAGIVEGNDFLPFRGKLLAHAVYEVDFGSHGEHAAGRGLADHLQKALGRTNAVGLLANFPSALGMHNHAECRDIWRGRSPHAREEIAGARSSGLSIELLLRPEAVPELFRR